MVIAFRFPQYYEQMEELHGSCWMHMLLMILARNSVS